MLWSASPQLAPKNVTLVEPVPPAFPRVTLLADRRVTVKPCETLPSRKPLLISTSRLLVIPRPDWHRTDVSDSHVDASHTVLPRLTS